MGHHLAPNYMMCYYKNILKNIFFIYLFFYKIIFFLSYVTCDRSGIQNQKKIIFVIYRLETQIKYS